MKKFLLALLAAVLFCGISQAGDGELGLINPEGWVKLAQVTADYYAIAHHYSKPGGRSNYRFTFEGRLQGRMLANFVHKGMTEEQVEEILGHWSSLSIVLAGGIEVRLNYLDHGLSVDFDGGQRVVKVHFWPLFD
jgi:hypothetical protein